MGFAAEGRIAGGVIASNGLLEMAGAGIQIN
jgi:hypothetical protein